MQNIINELYKTNLKFRTTNTGIIEILNNNFIPIAIISPITEDEDSLFYEFPKFNPVLTEYLNAKGEID